MWVVTALFTIEAADVRTARAVMASVMTIMDVPLSGGLKITRLTTAAWAALVRVDISKVSTFEPDNAITRLRYLIRNFDDVTWKISEADERRGSFEWAAALDGPPRRLEVLAHPAVRAAVIRTFYRSGS
jgi:hypothetical protein